MSKESCIQKKKISLNGKPFRYFILDIFFLILSVRTCDCIVFYFTVKSYLKTYIYISNWNNESKNDFYGFCAVSDSPVHIGY